MQEVVTQGLAEVAVLIVSLVVSVVVAYVASAAKEVLESQRTKRWSEALDRFDPAVSTAVRQLALSAEAKISQEADDLTREEGRTWIKAHALNYAEEFQKRTGVKFDAEVVVDKVLDAAIAEARSARKRDFRMDLMGQGYK